MKKLVILLVSFSLFMACNNDKAKYDPKDRNADYRDKDNDESRKNDDTKDEYGSDGWSEKERNKFLRDCLSESGDNPQAKKICSCVLGKLEKKYASLSEGDREGGEAEGRKMASQCLQDITGGDSDDNSDDSNNGKTDYDDGGDWSRSEEKRFVSECAGEAEKSVGEERANQYCDCMLQKAKKMYSSYAEADRKLAAMTQQQIQRLAADCNQ